VKILLKDAKNPDGSLVVPVTVNIRQVDDKGTNDGEVIYILEFLCGAVDFDRNRIDTVIISDVSAVDIKNQIEVGLSTIGRQIDWPNQKEDESAPRVIEIFPKNEDRDVNINSHVFGTVRDYFPTAGIDLSSVELRVNDINVTAESQIVGEETEFQFRWIPTVKRS